MGGLLLTMVSVAFLITCPWCPRGGTVNMEVYSMVSMVSNLLDRQNGTVKLGILECI